MKKLDDTQLEDFDTEFAFGDRWVAMTECIDRDFPSGEFSFLDVGGGNGTMADKLLQRYPNARGTVLDNAEILLERNAPDSRKTLLLKSVEQLGEVEEKFDLVCVHWLLHHLVGNSYAETRGNQLATLVGLRDLLAENGRISIYENIYTGWLFENFPGWLIYQLTSLKAIGRITRRMGANTGGVGVCFQAKRPWLDSISQAELTVREYVEPDDWVWPVKPEWKLLLHLKQIRAGHFWLSAAA